MPQQIAVVRRLLNYYEDTWLDGDFPPRMWNVHTAAMRTNNAVEGWHIRLKRAIGCSYPNTSQLLTVLNTEQVTTDLTLAWTDTGAPPPPQKYRNLDARLDRLRGEYRNGQMTMDDYLSALGLL